MGIGLKTVLYNKHMKKRSLYVIKKVLTKNYLFKMRTPPPSKHDKIKTDEYINYILFQISGMVLRDNAEQFVLNICFNFDFHLF